MSLILFLKTGLRPAELYIGGPLPRSTQGFLLKYVLASRIELLLPRLQIECITNYAKPTYYYY